MQEWADLVPPPQAARFHEIVVQAVQLRYRAITNSLAHWDQFMTTDVFDPEPLAGISSDFAEAERLLSKAQTEARQLGLTIPPDWKSKGGIDTAELCTQTPVAGSGNAQ